MIVIPNDVHYSGLTEKLISELAFYTGNIPQQHTLQDSITQNFLSIRNSNRAQTSEANGAAFEACIVNGLIEIGVHPNCIETQIVINAEKCIDFDIVIRLSDGSPVGVGAKTSLRERWMQWDRTAIGIRTYCRVETEKILGTHDFPIYGLFWGDEGTKRGLRCRNPKQKLCACTICTLNAINCEKRTQKKLIEYHDHTVVSVLNYTAMTSLQKLVLH
jgi:hypothetical protein